MPSEPVQSETIPPRIAPVPREPGWEDRLLSAVKRWFTEGNVPVKIGVLVLFAGVAALLRYAAVQGYFTFPIEWRLATVAAAAIAALGLGWRERLRKPAFGLSLQGGAIGVLLLDVFAGYSYYHLLPANLAFALVVVLVAGAALLAVLQRNMPLAALGFLGGYLAPVLINTGSNNYIGLFSYYAVLNAAVFGISWARSWRLLNLIGFFFTFGVGSAWGYKSYRPEFFATVEPFLVLFFLFYVVIGLLYVIRQTEHRRPWVDGTLVFGTPLVAFPLQAAMLKHDPMALAFSALLVASVYGGLVWYLRRRQERLLTEAYAALALGFATLAIPLAFSAGTTATLWALEGAGVAWLGLRQNRTFPWLAGLALQLLAAGSYVIAMSDLPYQTWASMPLLLNAPWLGAVFLAFSGFALSLIHDRHRPLPALPAILFLWACFWWWTANTTQIGRADETLGAWRYLMLAMATSVVLSTGLRRWLAWPRLNWLVLLCALMALPMVFYANHEFGSPLDRSALAPWLVMLAAVLAHLRLADPAGSRSLAGTHLLLLWVFALATTLELEDFSQRQSLAQGWQYAVMLAPLGLVTLGLWQRPQWLAWPRAVLFRDGYRGGWFLLAMPLLGFAIVSGLFAEGSASPLPYLPLLNPLELAVLALAGLLFAYGTATGRERIVRAALPYAGFAFATLATLRAVHHLHGEPWTMRILDSGFSQSALTVVWSLLGVSAWVLGSKRGNRRLWIGGAILMGIVLLKLIAVDRQYMGNIPGIVSFIAVGLLLVGVGYFAPSPPKREEAGEAA
jgi:uncharacterized membrane protein